MRPARFALESIAAAIATLQEGDTPARIEHAARAVYDRRSRVIVTGMGKCSHIGRKICATLQSTGQPAAFLHPGEALHGDLGMIMRRDTILALSNSGETDEVLHVARYALDRSCLLIALTANPSSPLGQIANHVLPVPTGPEGCPLGRAPMASSAAMLALGDAFAAELMARSGFTEAEFLRYHHGGYLGRKLREVA